MANALAFGVHSTSRYQPMRNALLILSIACVSTTCLSASSPRYETMSGQIVAYSISPTCLNGNGYWSMVIRDQHPKDMRSPFVRVDFSLPCGKSPEWVSAKPAVRKFRLFRQKECDAALVEFIDTVPRQDTATSVWKYPPGAESVTLPFGQVVPCYRSIDLPLIPVV
jgi:hypothetical protein